MLAALPTSVRDQARAAYRLFLLDPHHPGLNFKRVHTSERLVAVRVGRGYRAVGVLEAPDKVVWFWIGPHEQYETLLSNR